MANDAVDHDEFFDGWNTCITQLDDFAGTLR